MAFPPAGTVPTTDARSSVEIDSPALDPVDAASVDSGADIANRATNVIAGGGRHASEAEYQGALSGNETAYAALEAYYRDPVAAADRLSELDPAERRELSAGNLDVLGELRSEPLAVSTKIEPDVLGPGLAAYSQNRTQEIDTFAAAETRELDRATGREPGVDASSPETDLEPANEPGQSPSTNGQAGGLGGFMDNMKNAAQSGAGGGQQKDMTIEQSMQRQAISMGASL